MKEKSIIALFACLLFVLPVGLSVTTAENRDVPQVGAFEVDAQAEETSVFSLLLGLKVAGTYVDDGEFLGGLITFTGTRTLTAHGTQTSTNSNCCGGAAPNAFGQGNLQSIGLGNWKRTGFRQVTSTSIIFIQTFDPDDFGCKLGCPVDGPAVARVTLVEDFAPNFKTSSGSITTEIFLLSQDFADPDEVPLATIPGSFVATRLPVID